MPTEYNPQLIEAMSAKFRRLNNPAHAMADAVGMLKMFPGVVGIWPGSATDGAGQMIDVSGNGNHLTNNNTATFNAESDKLVSYAECVRASSQYFSHTDGAPFDILGTESHIAQNGLTFGCWMYTTEVVYQGVISKSNNSPNRSYRLFFYGPNGIGVNFSSDGSSAVQALNTASPIYSWYCAIGRFTPSTAVDLFVNGVQTTETAGIPASLNNNAEIFSIGSIGGSGFYLNGNTALMFLCAAAVPDIFIDTFYQFTAPLFGVNV